MPSPVPNRISLEINGETMAVPAVWLRLQCPCEQCRVPNIGDRRFALYCERADTYAMELSESSEGVAIRWSSGHSSLYSHAELSRILATSRRRRSAPRLWAADHIITKVDHDRFWADRAARVDAIETLRDEGIVMITAVPCESGEIERFLDRLGVAVRQTPFARVHDVRSSLDGYSIAETPDALPPHNDFASYTWPPSGQLLHMLRNSAENGDSILIDGWRLLEDLRREDPAAFDVLAAVPVPHRLYSETGETFARQPLIRLDPAGEITGLRYSNHTLQPLPLDEPRLDEWYLAYRDLGLRLADLRNQLRLRLDEGDMFIMHGQRILHGRTAFSGDEDCRHIQDSYFELDDFLAVRDRLTGEAR